MRLLVIGGCHVGSYGLRPQHGFIQQWAEHLRDATHEDVSVTSLPLVKLSHVPALLERHQADLNKANYVVLQLGHFELTWLKRFNELFQPVAADALTVNTQLTKPVPMVLNGVYPFTDPPADWLKRWTKDCAKRSLMRLHQWCLGPLPILGHLEEQLTDVLTALTPYRQKVVLLTPFPTLNRVDQWLRKESQPIFYRAGYRAGIRVVDTFRAIPHQAAYFQTDRIHLNVLGHTIVALLLSNLPEQSFSLAEQLALQF